MNLKNEFKPIRDWAKARGLYDKGDCKTQFVKLLEEIGELSKSILDEDDDQFKDAVGDCIVVMTNLVELHNKNTTYGHLTIELCINSAFEVIKNRTGKIVNSNFVKDV